MNSQYYLPTHSVIQKLISQHRVTLPWALSIEGGGEDWKHRRRRVKLYPTQSVMEENKVCWKVNCRQHWMAYTQQLATTIQTSRMGIAPGERTLFESLTFLSTNDPNQFQASYVLFDAKEHERLTYDLHQLVLEVPLTPLRTLEWHRIHLGKSGLDVV